MPIDYIQEARKEGRLFPACRHLELRLPQVEREGVILPINKQAA